MRQGKYARYEFQIIKHILYFGIVNLLRFA